MQQASSIVLVKAKHKEGREIGTSIWLPVNTPEKAAEGGPSAWAPVPTGSKILALYLDPTPAIVAIWGVSQQIQDFSHPFCNSSCF